VNSGVPLRRIAKQLNTWVSYIRQRAGQLKVVIPKQQKKKVTEKLIVDFTLADASTQTFVSDHHDERFDGLA
jgi:hypothetical protein